MSTPGNAEAPGCIWVSGEFCSPEQATVSVLDVGFLLGDGVFESMRASRGRPYLLDRHVGRLLAGAAAVGFERLPEARALEETVRETLRRARLQESYLRITVTRGRGGGGLHVAGGPLTTVIAALPLSEERMREDMEVEAISIGWEMGDTCGPSPTSVKSTSLQRAVLARRAVLEAGGGEGLCVSSDGRVLEGLTSNVFALLDGVLITPRVGECLPGITRGRVLELGDCAGMATCARAIDVDELARAEGIFLTNAVQGLRTVTRVNGERVGGPRGASVFASLCAMYEQDRNSAADAA
jgi:branched-subunit amino acid aminotransferase/4-amino-4-deoxychorismate lyase